MKRLFVSFIIALSSISIAQATQLTTSYDIAYLQINGGMKLANALLDECEESYTDNGNVAPDAGTISVDVSSRTMLDSAENLSDCRIEVAYSSNAHPTIAEKKIILEPKVTGSTINFNNVTCLTSGNDTILVNKAGTGDVPAVFLNTLGFDCQYDSSL